MKISGRIGLKNYSKLFSFFSHQVLDFEQQLQQPRTNAQQQQKGGSSDGFRVLQIPRAREVGQSYVSSVGTTLVAAYHSLMLILEER
jgi:hypothetical protein